MKTTIGDLLQQAHLQRTGPARAGEHEEYLAGWQQLARQAIRALDNVPLARASDAWPDELRAALAHLSRNAGSSFSSPTPPDDQLAGAALRIGAVADLLTDVHPANTPADEASAYGLQARIMTVLHEAARYSLTALQPQRRGHQAIVTVAALTEPWAVLPAPAKASRYLDQAAITMDDHSLDLATKIWQSAAADVLDSDHRVTALAYQTVAADLSILASVAAVALERSGPAAELAPAAVATAIGQLAEAQLRWRGASTWPAGLQLRGARAADLTQASTDLRAAVRDLLRRDNRWVTADELHTHLGPAAVIGMSRRIADIAAAVARTYTASFERLLHGAQRLWIPAATVPIAWQFGYTRAAARAGRWVALDIPGQNAARPLLRVIADAADATVRAQTTLHEAAAPPDARAGSRESRMPSREWSASRTIPAPERHRELLTARRPQVGVPR